MCRLFLALFLLGISAFQANATIECPLPPVQANQDTIVKTEAKVQPLGKLASGDLSNEMRVIAKDLFHEYKNADKIMIANTMVSVFCQIIRDSQTLSDAEKLERLSIFSGQVFATVERQSSLPEERLGTAQLLRRELSVPVLIVRRTAKTWDDP